MYVGNVMLLILNLPLVPVFAQILKVPYFVLYPIIFGISIVGVYTVSNSLFDVWMLGIFGLMGYLMRKLDFPAAPLVLGMVLGERLELALRQSLMMSQGDLSVLIGRPLSAGMLLFAAVLLIVPMLNRVRSWRIKAIEQEL
jgi:putative tricarboxylic transport membrane protein